MKKILFVIGQLRHGGAERQLVYLASHLNPQKYQVLVCSLSDDVPLKNILDENNVETVIIPQVMKPDITRFWKLTRIITNFNPDIIHSYLIVADTFSRVIGAILGIPVIISERSSAFEEPYFYPIIKKIFKPFGSALIANSYSGAERVIEKKEFNRKKIFVVHNGVDIDKYSKIIDPNGKLSYLEKFGLKEFNKIVGIIGNLRHEKNHELLFDSFKILKQFTNDVAILCVGDGPERDNLSEYVSRLNISDSVKFVGNRENIPVCLSLMDVLVLPSRWEGLPNVILEAMAARVPVVATDVGGVGEIISDGKTGWLAKPNDPNDLAEKISRVLIDDITTKRIVNQAFELVQNEFSIESLVTSTEKVYDVVLHKSKKRLFKN